MSKPRFLADHNLNDHIVDGVLRREPGAEFLRLRDVGDITWEDPKVLEFAADRNLIVVSQDIRTMPKHGYARIARGETMSGLLMANQLDPIGPVIDSLVLTWAASEAEEWLNVVYFLPI